MPHALSGVRSNETYSICMYMHARFSATKIHFDNQLSISLSLQMVKSKFQLSIMPRAQIQQGKLSMTSPLNMSKIDNALK